MWNWSSEKKWTFYCPTENFQPCLLAVYGQSYCFTILPIFLDFDSLQGCLDQVVSWSTRPTTVLDGSDHYFHKGCLSVRPKTSKSSENHCRARTDGWPSGSLMTPLSCFTYFQMLASKFSKTELFSEDSTVGTIDTYRIFVFNAFSQLDLKIEIIQIINTSPVKLSNPLGPVRNVGTRFCFRTDGRTPCVQIMSTIRPGPGGSIPSIRMYIYYHLSIEKFKSASHFISKLHFLEQSITPCNHAKKKLLLQQ